MGSIKDAQEILLAAADVAIQIFALESAVLRAEKILPSLSENRKTALKAAIKLFAFTTAETTSTAAKKAAYFAEEGDTPVSYTHLRAHETRHDLVCRLLL